MQEIESDKVSKRSGESQKEKKNERISEEERKSIREKSGENLFARLAA